MPSRLSDLSHMGRIFAGRVIAAERAANLEVCLTGKYPSLCRKNWLTTEQLQKVVELERQNQRQSPFVLGRIAMNFAR